MFSLGYFLNVITYEAFVISLSLSLVCLVQQLHQLALVCLEHKVQALVKPRLVQVDCLGKQDLDWVNNRYM